MKKYKLNQQIGELTVTSFDSTKGNYLLTCSCGKTIQGSASYVDLKAKCLERNGFAACRVCWNSFNRNRTLTSDNLRYKRVYTAYQKRAKEINQPFEITLDEAIVYFTDECYYCGDKFSNSRARHGLSGKHFVSYNGIDRLDPGLGYTKDNIVTCCKTCNYAKYTMRYDVFMDKIVSIYNKHVQRSSRQGVEPSGLKRRVSEFIGQ